LESANRAAGEGWVDGGGDAAAAGKRLLTVRRWRRRYVASGVDGLLKDATRPSRVKPLTAEKKQVVDMTRLEKPPNATHWSGTQHGRGGGHLLQQCPAAMACARAQAALGRDLKVRNRFEIAGCDRANKFAALAMLPACVWKSLSFRRRPIRSPHSKLWALAAE
jgi:hypothetical protein